MTGYVKTWVETKMYGFIRCAEDGKDYFFHRDDLTYPQEYTNVKQGINVNFTGKATPKGLRASEITLGV